jgi:predicted alpha/beta superfamily hydrolase
MEKSFLILVIAGFLMLGESGIQAQTSDMVINQKQEHILKSKINGNTYHLYVSLPMHYSPLDTMHYSVLYMLDGNYWFPVAHSARYLLDFGNEIEQVIIVGIGYNWEYSIEPMFYSRMTDYLPFKDISFDTSSYWKSFVGGRTLSSGGGPAFLNVLRKEIIPFIDNQYKTNHDRGIFGHSGGGLFSAYCLFTATDIFQRFGIFSPSLWLKNNEMFKMEKSFSKQHNTLNAKVFMAVGGLEGFMVTDMTAFADSLKRHNYKGLILTKHIFEDEDHLSVYPAILSRGLRVLYGNMKKQ